jgi:hypothetical protein
MNHNIKYSLISPIFLFFCPTHSPHSHCWNGNVGYLRVFPILKTRWLRWNRWNKRWKTARVDQGVDWPCLTRSVWLPWLVRRRLFLVDFTRWRAVSWLSQLNHLEMCVVWILDLDNLDSFMCVVIFFCRSITRYCRLFSNRAIHTLGNRTSLMQLADFFSVWADLARHIWHRRKAWRKLTEALPVRMPRIVSCFWQNVIHILKSTSHDT